MDVQRRELRKQLVERRRALSPAERIAAAQGLRRSLEQLPEYLTDVRVAGYWACDGELPLNLVIPPLASRGQQFYLPLINEDGTLRFAPWNAGDGVQPNRYGIPEPVDPKEWLAPFQLDLVLVPLLGPGLLQPTQCVTALSNGNCGGVGSNTAATAFRIGVDGSTAPLQQPSTTLPQPYYPGVNGISSATASILDPNFRPNEVDSVNLTIQRQLSRKVILEVGYIGRRITHEYQPINLNAVPYMMTQGGQQFAQAYKNVVLQLCGGVQGLAGGGCNGNGAGGPLAAASVTDRKSVV